MTTRSTSLSGGGIVVTLLLAAPRPAAAVSTLLHMPAAADEFAPVLAAVSVVAWSLTGWLLLVSLLTAAGQLPGLLGRLARRLERRIAPRAVRHAVALALGMSALTSVVGADAALAAASPAGPAPVTAATTSGPPAPPTLDWPTATTGPPAVAGPAATAPARYERSPATAPPLAKVVVRPGDSLWVIAQRQLPRTATAGQIAASWPRWWAANRDLIGPDPDLIQPGDRLTPPPAT